MGVSVDVATYGDGAVFGDCVELVFLLFGAVRFFLDKNRVFLDRSRVFWTVVRVICFLVFGVVVEVFVFSFLPFDVVEALLVVGIFFPLSCFDVVPCFL